MKSLYVAYFKVRAIRFISQIVLSSIYSWLFVSFLFSYQLGVSQILEHFNHDIGQDGGEYGEKKQEPNRPRRVQIKIYPIETLIVSEKFENWRSF